MTQMQLFQERVYWYKKHTCGEPLYVVLTAVEFDALKDECESFGTIEMSDEEIKKAESEYLYSDQVATCFGVPVIVPSVTRVI